MGMNGGVGLEEFAHLHHLATISAWFHTTWIPLDLADYQLICMMTTCNKTIWIVDLFRALL